MMIDLPPICCWWHAIQGSGVLFGTSRFDPTKLPTFSTNLTVRSQEKQDPDIDQGILEDIEDLSDSSDDGLSALNTPVRKNFRLPKSKLNVQEEKILKNLDKKRQSIEEPGYVINFLLGGWLKLKVLYSNHNIMDLASLPYIALFMDGVLNSTWFCFLEMGKVHTMLLYTNRKNVFTDLMQYMDFTDIFNDLYKAEESPQASDKEGKVWFELKYLELGT